MTLPILYHVYFPFQVSRSTGILSHFVNLNIVIPEAFIVGSGEHHVDVGSIINLVCMIDKVRLHRDYSSFLIYCYFKRKISRNIASKHLTDLKRSLISFIHSPSLQFVKKIPQLKFYICCRTINNAYQKYRAPDISVQI